MRRVLIVQYSSNRDGSAFSGLLSADGLREAGWSTHVAFGFDGPVIADYEASGHAIHVVPHKNWLRRERPLQFIKDVADEWGKARAFERLIERVKPDVVYVNSVVSLAGAVAARRQRIPCIWHLREMFADVGGEMHSPRWAVPVVRYVIRAAATEVVANSAATARNVLGTHAAREVPVIPNAAGGRFFEDSRSPQDARRDLGVPGEALIVGVPGTLRPMKGHLFFVRSIAPVLRERTDCHVVMTGGTSGDYAEEVTRTVEELGLEDQVHFLGWVQDMPGFYRACDLACVPSRAEPFGRTVIEAFASGTPVVATAVGGMQETIAPGETGLLVPYGDEEALAAAIRTLLDDRDLRQAITEQARSVAEEEYHERVYKQRIVTLTESVTTHGHHLQGA